MRQYYKVILTIFVFFFIFGCKKNEEIGYDVQIPGFSTLFSELKLIDTLRIQLDSTTSSNNYYGYIRILDGDPYYCIFNNFSSTVQAYNLADSSKNWTIQIANEGSNAVTQIDRVYVENRDSVFIVSDDYIHELYLFNSKGLKINSYKIILPSEYNNYWTWHDEFYDFVYDPTTKTIGLWMYPDNRAQEDGYDFYKMSKAVRFNIVTGDIQTFGRFPNDYFKDNNLFENLAFINSYEVNNLEVLYFFASSEIQVYDLKTCQLLATYDVSSKWIKKTIPPIMKVGQERQDLEVGRKYLQQTPFYARMFSNQDGSLHVRIVKHSVNLMYPDGRKRNWYDQPFSIIVLDKDFRTITERKFEGGKYDFYQVFVLENKIYVSLNNLLNESADDDYFQFAVFAVL